MVGNVIRTVSNRLGWIVAGGLVVVLAPVVLLIWLWPGSPAPPSPATTGPGRLDRIDVPTSLWELVNRPTGSGLAADDYNKAVVEYFDSDRYRDLRRMSDAQQLAIAPGKFPYKVWRFVLAGSAKRQMSYFSQYVSPTLAMKPSYQEMAEPAEEGKPPIPHLVAFSAVARAALLYGRTCERHKEVREAERVYKAVLIFGWHVTEDRARLWGFQVGLGILKTAGERLEEFYKARGDKGRADKVSKFLGDLNQTIDRVATKANETLFRLDKTGHLPVGDLLNLAAHDADPMWRIEAIRQLGLARAAMGRGGPKADRQAINKMLADLKINDDRMMRAAAELALGMTVQDVRSVR
jgi:hypothetical protein